MDELNALLKTAMQKVAELNEKGILLGRKRYTTVAQRNEVFREVFGFKGRILTSVVSADDDKVVVECTVQFRIGEAWETLGNGFAEEKRNSSQVNRTSALENAETSAIGRALANIGLHGGEFASANEVENAIHQQGQPDRKPAPVSLISAEQAANIRALATETGTDAEKFFAWCSTKFGYTVSKWSDIHAPDHDRAMNALDAKRAKGAA